MTQGAGAAAEPRQLGRRPVTVSAVSFGAAPIGNFTRPFSDAAAREMVDQAWDLGMRLFDTAPGYGNGLSEYRLGHALHERPRSEYTLSTKVGRVLRRPEGRVESGPWVDPAFDAVYDYSYDGVLRSFEDSLQRLLTDRIDILLMHDVDRYAHGDRQPERFAQARDGGFRALERLRDEGVVGAIGIGVNEADVCVQALQVADLDCLLLAGRYTLLEQESLDDLLPLCTERGVGVILGGVLNSGILATGAREGARFDYAPASEAILQRTGRLSTICDRHGAALPAVAMQFAAAHPAVRSICLGARDPGQQRQNVAWFEEQVPPQLWEDLRTSGLIRQDAPTPQIRC